MVSGFSGIVAAASLLASASQVSADANAPIAVEIHGLRVPGGSVRVDVCTADTFLKDACPFSGVAPAELGCTRVVVAGVPPGTYAIQAYHDINDNGTVDRGALGLPREGLAFSNDAPLGLSGPSFRQAAFVHGSAPQLLRLRLHHFRRAPPRPPASQPGTEGAASTVPPQAPTPCAG